MKKLASIVLLFVSILCFGQIPDPLPNTYVNDGAGVLNAEQIHYLNERILTIEKASSVQIAVVLVNQLPDGMDVADFAIGVGRKWHVGNAQNGLVYVASIGQRKQHLAVASALEGSITDADALAITDDLKPYFKNKDYYGGINSLLDGINERVNPVAKQQKALADAERQKQREKEQELITDIFLWLLAFGVAGLSAWLFYFRPRQRKAAKIEAEEYEKRQAEYREYKSRPTFIVANVFQQTKPDSEDDEPKPVSSSSYSDERSSSPKNNDSDYGNWGSGSSDNSSSFHSGFSGGGSSNDW